jgi:hypothetical protein
MVKHIYGRLNLLEGVSRPHVFINELKLYLDYLKNDIHMNIAHMNIKKEKYHKSFKEQLQNGINYYKDLMPKMLSLKNELKDRFNQELLELELKLNNIQLYSVKD